MKGGGDLSSRLRDIARELEDLEREAEQLEDRGGFGQDDLDEARGEGYEEGRTDLVRSLFAQLDRREAGSQLPFPVYSDVMTYEEVRKLIKKETT